MIENFGIGDRVSFSIKRAKPIKKTMLQKVYKAIIYVPKKIVRLIKKANTDEEHPVNSHK